MPNLLLFLLSFYVIITCVFVCCVGPATRDSDTPEGAGEGPAVPGSG